MLNDARESVVRSRDNIEPLGSRLEVVVWQLPVRLSKNADRLRRFCDDLRAVWPGVRHTIEFRHASWFDDEIAEIVGDADVAVCQSDAADWPIWEAVTAGFVYLRLHGHTRTYRSRYSADLLGKWADRIAGWLEEGRDVYAFFDNDAEGAAPRDALRLKERLEARE